MQLKNTFFSLLLLATMSILGQTRQLSHKASRSGLHRIPTQTQSTTNGKGFTSKNGETHFLEG